MPDTRRRSLTKSITYRVLTIVVDAAIIYTLTKRVDITISLTVITNIASTLLYYVHERGWSYIGWGKVRRR